jgi:magnesium-transporting ATPase (P-type)
MSDPKKRSRGFGMPRPYSSTDLPSPRRILQELFAPLELWIVSIILVVFSAVSVVLVALVTPFGYNTGPMLVAIALSTLGILVQSSEPSSDSVLSVPSIKNVSRTVEYMKLSSRVTVVSLVSGLVAAFVLVTVHMFENVEINPLTRLTVVLSLFVAYLSSYLIIRTLCSYTPLHKNSKISLPVEVSSFPEIATVVGFILPPVLIIYTGFVYKSPSFVSYSIEFTVVDSLAVCLGIYVLYFSLVSRI